LSPFCSPELVFNGMENNNSKIVLVLTHKGLESVMVDALDSESRQMGYNVCAALEPTFAEVNKIVREMYSTMAERIEAQ